MSCGNPYKHIIKNAFTPFIDNMSWEKKLSDEKLDCMQFGIWDYRRELVEEVHFFITNKAPSNKSLTTL